VVIESLVASTNAVSCLEKLVSKMTFHMSGGVLDLSSLLPFITLYHVIFY